MPVVDVWPYFDMACPNGACDPGLLWHALDPGVSRGAGGMFGSALVGWRRDKTRFASADQG